MQNSLTWKLYMKEYDNLVSNRERSPQTKKQYVYYLIRLENIMKKDLNETTLEDIKIAVREMELSIGTKQIYLKCFKHYLKVMKDKKQKTAVNGDDIKYSLIGDYGKKRKNNNPVVDSETVIRKVDREILYKYLDWELKGNYKKGMKIKSIIVTFLKTGVRVSEIIKLDTKDFDSEKNTITIRFPKGSYAGRGWPRTIALTESDSNIIKEYLKVRMPSIDTEEPLFTTKHGKRYGVAGVKKICYQTTTNALGRRLSPHKFRHSFATMCATELDIPSETLAHYMGHFTNEGKPNVNMVMKYYNPTQEYLNEVLVQAQGGHIPDKIGDKVILKEPIPSISMDNQTRLQLLEDRLLLGEISSSVYEHLRAKYESCLSN